MKTRLFPTLGISAPVLQSGMRGVAGPELAAAVSNAGGLGVLAALRMSPDQIRASIRQIRELTDRPFGVNLWLHEDVRHSPDIEALADDLVRSSQSVLNELRPRFDLPTTLDRPDPMPDLVDQALEVLIEERVPVFSAAIGVAESELVARFHEAGSKVVAMVATIDDGVKAAANGADVVVAQGSEAGGHRSYGTKLEMAQAQGQSTLVLVPQMIDALDDRIPVVAAGGIVDGRGLAAMLGLGAAGVLLGTRFVATRESAASDMWKRRLTEGERRTTLTDGFTGQWARVLESEFVDHWKSSGATPLPGLLQASATNDIVTEAKRVDDDQMQPLYAGAGAATMSAIPGAGEVVTQIVAEAESILASLHTRRVVD